MHNDRDRDVDKSESEDVMRQRRCRASKLHVR